MFEKTAVVDYRMDEKCREGLKKLGFRLINSYKNDRLYNAIRGHVDINMFVNEGDVVVSPESYEYYKKEFQEKNCNVNLICGKDMLSEKYPEDVLYNICYTGKYYIGNFNFADCEVKKSILDKLRRNSKDTYFEKNDQYFNGNSEKKEAVNKYKSIKTAQIRLRGEYSLEDTDWYRNECIKKLSDVIEIKQGYSNCSICQVNKNSVITYDKGISKILRGRGLEVLEIEKGHIELFELDYGFIGGASANIGDSIVFFGDIMKHPDGEKICRFIEKCGKNTISLSNEVLKDYGSMFIF